ncbi:GGDEF domain-containing protein [Pannonibacter indicus]|uniref:GGDEF domain-containing protein n=1 Tax=Pannonibacter indicus TaxID=466044 RepID=UPI00391D3497
MTIDTPSMLAVFACLFLAGGLQLFRQWRLEREHAGILLWSVSLLVRVPGFVLLASRESLSGLWVLHLGHSLLCLGAGLGYAATRHFSGRHTSLLAMLTPIILWNGLCIVPGFLENTTLRLTSLSFILMFVSAVTAFEFQRALLLSKPVRLVFAILFAGASLMHASRMVLLISAPETTEYFSSLGAQGSVLQFLVAILLSSAAILASTMLFRDGQLQNLRREAEEDVLTGLLNRGAFRRAAAVALETARRDGTPVCMILCDLDHFKAVNDRFGHAGGDSVLQAFSQLMRDRLGPHGLTGRIGGEEFACLLTGDAALAAYGLAEGLRVHTRVLSMLGGTPDFRITVSAGIGIMPVTTADVNGLLQRADCALYAAKRKGRDCVEVEGLHGKDAAGGKGTAPSPVIAAAGAGDYAPGAQS